MKLLFKMDRAIKPLHSAPHSVERSDARLCDNRTLECVKLPFLFLCYSHPVLSGVLALKKAGESFIEQLVADPEVSLLDALECLFEIDDR